MHQILEGTAEGELHWPGHPGMGYRLASGTIYHKPSTINKGKRPLKEVQCNEFYSILDM